MDGVPIAALWRQYGGGVAVSRRHSGWSVIAVGWLTLQLRGQRREALVDAIEDRAFGPEDRPSSVNGLQPRIGLFVS